MINAACRLFDLVVEAMKQGHLVYFVVLPLDSKLPFPIVTSNKYLALLCNYDSCLFSATHALYDYFLRI